jgi:hypothetical protein
MAIAPSRLGQLVNREWHSETALLQALRKNRLVRAAISEEQLYAAFKRAREEHAALPPGQREFNSPNERVRVFLGPFLTFKGRRWAVPLRSLDLRNSDDRRPWWKFWN